MKYISALLFFVTTVAFGAAYEPMDNPEKRARKYAKKLIIERNFVKGLSIAPDRVTSEDPKLDYIENIFNRSRTPKSKLSEALNNLDVSKPHNTYYATLLRELIRSLPDDKPPKPMPEETKRNRKCVVS